MSIPRQLSDFPFPVLAEVVISRANPRYPWGMTKMAGRVSASALPSGKWLSQPVVAKDVASGENKPTSHLRGKAQSGIETKDLAAWRPARFNYFTALTDSIFSKVKGASTVA